MSDPGFTLPPRNLPPEAEAWGREMESLLREALGAGQRAQQKASNISRAQTGISVAQGEQAEILATHTEQLEAATQAAATAIEHLAPTEPPPTPSLPSVTTAIGIVKIAWGGLFPLPSEIVEGEEQEQNLTAGDVAGLRAVYAEMTLAEPPLEEPVEGEPPHPWGRVGQPLTDAGVIVVPATVGTVVWVRLVAANSAGFISTPTAPVEVTVVGVDVPDFEEAVIELIGEGGGSGSATIDATTDPEVDGSTVGDTWRKFSSLDESGQLQGIWRWNGTGWVQTALVVDGSIVARMLNTEEIWADEAFVEKATINVLTAGVVTGEMIQGDAIDGKTITGATIQTDADPDAGVKLDSFGLRSYDTGGTQVFEVTPAGNVFVRGTVRSGSTSAAAIAMGPASGVWPDRPAGGSGTDGVMSFTPTGTDSRSGGVRSIASNVGGVRNCKLQMFGPLSSNVALSSYTQGGRAYLEIENNVDGSGVNTDGNVRVYGDKVTLGGGTGSVVDLLSPGVTGTVNLGMRTSSGHAVNIGYGTDGAGPAVITIKGEPMSFGDVATDADDAKKVGLHYLWSTYANSPSSGPGTIQVVRGSAGSSLKQFFTPDGANAWTHARWSGDNGATWGAWAYIGPPLDTGWQNLTAASGWTNNGMQYKVKGGVCYLRGEFYGGSDATAVFTLPSGARPLARMPAFIARVVGSTVPPWGTLNIQTSGVATFVAVSGAVVSSSPGYGMGAISFPVE